MAVFLAFSRAPLTGPNRCDSPKGDRGVHRNPTELLDHRCRKPNVNRDASARLRIDLVLALRPVVPS